MEKAKLLKTRGGIMTQKIINNIIATFKSSDKSLEDICKGFNLTGNEVDYLYYIVAKHNICRKLQEKVWEPEPMSKRQVYHYLKEYNERLDDELISSFNKILLKDEIRGYER